MTVSNPKESKSQIAEPKITLAQIIARISIHQPVLNQADFSATQLELTIGGIGSLDKASSNQLSFLSSKAYADALPETNAGIILVSADHASQVPEQSIAVVVSSPYLAYASVTHLFEASVNPASAVTKRFIHPTAQVAKTAVLGDNVRIGPYCIVGEHTQIGSGTRLQSHIHVGDYVSIGQNCEIYPHVYIAYQCEIGNGVRIHASASIGSEGFGYAPKGDTASEGWERIVQLGRVIIGDGVRIGSQTCIDRGAVEDTVIGDNVIIDNLVQIGHNTVIGDGSALAGNAGLAGSSVLGKRCMIGGGAGVAGHLEITDDVILTGMTMATKTINQSGVYSSGIGAMPAKEWRRALVQLKQLGKKEN